MSETIIKVEPLTREAFAEFGDVIAADGADYFYINEGSTRRFNELATVEAEGEDARAIISIFRANPLSMPLRIEMMERHPHGSQAFIPLKGNPFIILVAPKGEEVKPENLRAFLSDGRSGVNYHKGVWHHPILVTVPYDDHLVVDRAGKGDNCDLFHFDESEQIILQP